MEDARNGQAIILGELVNVSLNGIFHLAILQIESFEFSAGQFLKVFLIFHDSKVVDLGVAVKLIAKNFAFFYSLPVPNLLK